MKMSRLHSFGFGFSLPFRALQLIARAPGLLVLCIIPVLIAAAILIGGLGSLKAALYAGLLQGLANWGWSPPGWLASVLSVLLGFMVTIAGAYLFSALLTVVAAPFNDLIAENTERRASPPLAPVPPTPFWRRLRVIWIDILKTLAAAATSLSLMFLAWVPLLNLVLLILSALLMTFQFTSYPQTRRGVGLPEGVRFLFRYFFACFGFGSILLVLFAIPGVSILVLPLAVVGGTLLVARTQGVPRLR